MRRRKDGCEAPVARRWGVGGVKQVVVEGEGSDWGGFWRWKWQDFLGLNGRRGGQRRLQADSKGWVWKTGLKTGPFAEK